MGFVQAYDCEGTDKVKVELVVVCAADKIDFERREEGMPFSSSFFSRL